MIYKLECEGESAHAVELAYELAIYPHKEQQKHCDNVTVLVTVTDNDGVIVTINLFAKKFTFMKFYGYNAHEIQLWIYGAMDALDVALEHIDQYLLEAKLS